MRLDDWMEKHQAYEASDDLDGNAVFDDEVEIETPNDFDDDALIVDEDLEDEGDDDYDEGFDEDDEDDDYDY